MPFKLKKLFKRRSKFKVIPNLECGGSFIDLPCHTKTRPQHSNDNNAFAGHYEEKKHCVLCKDFETCESQGLCQCKLTPVPFVENNTPQLKTWNKKQEPEKMQELNNIFKEDQVTFNRLKRKINNIKIFYPEIYSIKENIIEAYGKNVIRMSQDVLNFDEDKSTVI